MMPVTFDRAGLTGAGFQGFSSVAELAEPGGTQPIPSDPGVYVVLREAHGVPKFLDVGTGGWFQEADPNVATDLLRDRWVSTTPVLYVGKASSLRARVRQLVQFGQGKAVGHYGGRYLWQVAGSSWFVVAWQIDLAPARRESQLLSAFHEAHGSLPFANLRW
jgi:hypothetical protein